MEEKKIDWEAVVGWELLLLRVLASQALATSNIIIIGE